MHLNSFRDQWGYWGNVTSSIDWCEPNYVQTPYIAEFWNSQSSIVISIGGLVGMYWVWKLRLEMQLFAYCVVLAIVGIGSALYHGTLLFHTQMLDELPMIYCLTCWWYTWFYVSRHLAAKVNYKKYGAHEAGCKWFETVYFLKPFMGVGLFLQNLPVIGEFFRNRLAVMVAYNIIFSVLHCLYKFTVLFQVHFGLFSLCGVLMSLEFLKHFEKSVAKKVYMTHFIGYGVLAGAAFSLWLVDNIMCESLLSLPVYPQFHAWWHVLSGLSTYTIFVCSALNIMMLKSAKLIGLDVSSKGDTLNKNSEELTLLKSGEIDFEKAQFLCDEPAVDIVRISGIPVPYHYVYTKGGKKL